MEDDLGLLLFVVFIVVSVLGSMRGSEDSDEREPSEHEMFDDGVSDKIYHDGKGVTYTRHADGELRDSWGRTRD
ncbi:hypothetical protein F9L16_04450 [Agarivorans sp. B2Z047]|uniref:hypothetical protein n=1 Tax=Agarivorans sp. B2Z047 TaxID=2652721 RepID=UPI00128E19C2|nr:hypothetical protein [Agarivorans sp. B2Z047]MPW28249.1 hypothetical protein [Agarivorans sp. B2Z047]UQN43922.1 hypothetical protein LQZ07_05490 [Agarivorans sp. B2Z047]